MPIDPDDFTKYSDAPVWPIITLLMLGFIVGAVGHVYASKATILAGLFMIFFATVVLPAIVVFSL